MAAPSEIRARGEQYALRQNIAIFGELGDGKDGHVWRTSRPSALKVHDLRESYRIERDAYTRLSELQITAAAGFAIPEMWAFDDELLAIEMDIVFPPFVVDFASAHLDFAPDWIEDEGNSFADMVRDRFGDRGDSVLVLYQDLVDRAGIYLLDLNPSNVKFGKSSERE